MFIVKIRYFSLKIRFIDKKFKIIWNRIQIEWRWTWWICDIYCNKQSIQKN